MANVKVFATDGFRYLAYEPPIDSEAAEGIPNPIRGFGEQEHELQPTGHGKLRSSGLIVDTGWMVEAFGSNERFIEHAQKVAEHLGGVVLNPNYFK